MKKVPVVFCILLFFIFGNCQPKEIGCTDANALNFNASASVSDSSCTYEADKFVGNYTTEDIIEYADSSNTGVRSSSYYYRRYSFTIVREKALSIVIKNFANCGTDATATKGYLYSRFFDNKIEIPSIGKCLINDIKFELKNDTLFYSYVQNTNLIVVATGKELKGKATGKAVRK